jgi:hypothetical protein
MKRYAIVTNARTRREAEAYLPENYKIIGQAAILNDRNQAKAVWVIAGEDVAGWTLDGYVIPRYGSGLIVAEEIDLSHPVMKEIPA